MKFFYTILLLSVWRFGYAQDAEYGRWETRDLNTDYIVDYSDSLSIKIYGIIKSNLIAHVDNFTGRQIEYKPNENFNVGFGVGYKWFGLDLAFNLLSSNDDDEIFGKTSRFDFQASVYTRKLVVDLNVQSYKGYYGFNPETYKVDFDPSNPVYPLRPDMKTVNVGMSALYVFKHDKFSFRSAFTYNERQIKSAGSFLAGPYLGYFTMDADSTIVPIEVRDEFNPEADFRGTHYIRLGISGGYAHTFVIGKRVFFSLAFVLGLGPEIIKSPALNGHAAETKSVSSFRVGVRTALGYNSRKFYAGLSAIGVTSGDDDNEAFLSRGVSNFKIFIGKRLSPPKFLK